jgi:hypothetical protein
VYDRGNFGVPGERECKRKKNDGENEERENRYGRKERKSGAECARRRERDNRVHVEWM